MVYGDIGTSPLYAMKECFNPAHGVAPLLGNVLGVLSLVFWALTLIISVKYISFVLRADNHGDGGILALLALVTEQRSHPGKGETGRKRWTILVSLALVGTSLLLAEGMITPAISVLSALEGLDVATPIFRPWIVPLAVGILLALFLVQRKGTAGIGAVFGKVMLVWFAAIAALGIPAILRHPEVLGAINPAHAVRFFGENGLHGFLILGSVVLCVTGGEALYADMGHFGRGPIRISWFSLVFPALLLNYFGQGSLLLERGTSAVANPFYGLAPSVLLYPLVILATAAAVIASQAMISGAFSLAQQAVQLGYLPRLSIIHTSGEASGQIYVPEINRLLMIACIALTLGFRDSSKLAGAYGISVMGAMICTSVLLSAVAIRRWKWSPALAFGLVALFLAVEIPFLLANIPKIVHGGWFPLLVGSLFFFVMTTWKIGRHAVRSFLEAREPADRSISRPSRVVQPAPGEGNGGLHDLGDGGDAADPAASLQAQQGAAREGHPVHDRDRGHPGGAEAGQDPDARVGAWIQRSHRALRFHADTERAARSAPRGGTGPRVRPRYGELLPRPRDHPHHRQLADVRHAQESVRLPRPQRAARQRLLPHSSQPRHRARRAGRARSPPRRA